MRRLLGSSVWSRSCICSDCIVVASCSSGSVTASWWVDTDSGTGVGLGRACSRRTMSTARRWVSMASQEPMFPRFASNRAESR